MLTRRTIATFRRLPRLNCERRMSLISGGRALQGDIPALGAIAIGDPGGHYDISGLSAGRHEC